MSAPPPQGVGTEALRVPPYWEALERVAREEGFRGELTASPSERIAQSTDNSIYQIVPDAIAYPCGHDDVVAIIRALARPDLRHVPITPRGGLTGTNGQSLNEGLVLDLSRHMTRVLSIDPQARTAEVEAGIVRDRLNDRLSAHGLFFAATTSTSDRCTIGGMIATDAAGKGSHRYGKTSDNLLALDMVLADGQTVALSPKAIGDPQHPLVDRWRAVCERARPVLLGTVPQLPRRFAGYDLISPLNAAGRFDPTRIVAGAEGTLGIVTRARLRLHAVPAHTRLVVVAHRDLLAAVAAARDLMADDPDAVETLDDVVVGQAREEGLLASMPSQLTAMDGGAAPAWNYVEFSGDDAAALDAAAQAFAGRMAPVDGVVGVHVAVSAEQARSLWSVRKAAVGLLAGMPGDRQPLAFVEDCAVPPERMQGFLRDVRALFAAHGLRAGMFGHVDVGCMHVRPALDLTQPVDRDRIRLISDAMAEIAHRHGGVLWGEHGKGFRGEYLEALLGDKAYAALRAIKAAADPAGRLNPGKIVMPAETQSVVPLDAAPMRGARNAQAAARTSDFSLAFRCNGNAACLSSNHAQVMCPSYKVTRDRRHSPKGRADLLREWVRRETAGTLDRAFTGEVEAALDGCLGCKACTSSCPVHVDIPEMKSRFLHRIAGQRGLRLDEKALHLLEPLSIPGARVPVFPNTALRLPGMRGLLKNVVGLVDVPAFSRPSLSRRLADMGARFARPADMQPHDAGRPILLVDPMTAAFDAQAVVAALGALHRAGFHPLVAQPEPAGKPLHVTGARDAFARVARRYAASLRAWRGAGARLISLEPSHHATLAQDYRHIEGLGDEPAPEPLHRILGEAPLPQASATGDGRNRGRVLLFSHCTERTGMPDAPAAWRRLLEQAGYDVQAPATGCCGMAGAYGHQARHAGHSRRLYDMHWAPLIDRVEGPVRIAATGYSCRTQVKRFQGGVEACHPAQLIADVGHEAAPAERWPARHRF